jgi:molybdenum cofactor cytidylyltransferase
MPPRTEPFARAPHRFITGLVLAAGGSTRLGRPKQLLPYGDGTLLGHVMGTAHRCSFDQTIVAIGGSAGEVRARVDLAGAQVVVNDAYGAGCSSSIAAALAVVDPRCQLLVLMLGDQPGVTADTVATLLAGRDDAPLAVCRYDDGNGHPIAFARSVFPALAELHGDKGVWRLLDQRSADVAHVPVAGPIPRDVDTPEDYQAVQENLVRRSPDHRSGSAPAPARPVS